MVALIFIFFGLAILTAPIILTIDDDRPESNVLLGVFTMIVFNIILFIALDAGFKLRKISEPDAIDVYRGRTKLNITSLNGVPTDTIVVFKNN